mmetsp:Transcript_43667/g.127077  ORF Transcript_43667/g.127077 Transcript_43667/m.127077 type:complete len:346 (+) Transcript_43667:839-1876(+)
MSLFAMNFTASVSPLCVFTELSTRPKPPAPSLCVSLHGPTQAPLHGRSWMLRSMAGKPSKTRPATCQNKHWERCFSQAAAAESATSRRISSSRLSPKRCMARTLASNLALDVSTPNRNSIAVFGSKMTSSAPLSKSSACIAKAASHASSSTRGAAPKETTKIGTTRSEPAKIARNWLTSTLASCSSPRVCATMISAAEFGTYAGQMPAGKASPSTYRWLASAHAANQPKRRAARHTSKGRRWPLSLWASVPLVVIRLLNAGRGPSGGMAVTPKLGLSDLNPSGSAISSVVGSEGAAFVESESGKVGRHVSPALAPAPMSTGESKASRPLTLVDGIAGGRRHIPAR